MSGKFCVITQKSFEHPFIPYLSPLRVSVCPCPLHPQLPRQVTINDSTLVAVLPVEIAWWFVWRYGWAPSGWILVLSNRAELVAGLAVRAAAGVNLV